MATPPLTETLTITETERHLQEALTLVKYDLDTRTTVTFPLDDLEQARSLPDLNRQLSNVAGSLLNLSRRSFPSYRPVIVEYAKLVALMQTGKVNSREAVPKISQLREIRNLSMKTARRVRDYMDWYEINTRSGTGKTFASYAAAVKILREQEQPANTPVSRYLDDIENCTPSRPGLPCPPCMGRIKELRKGVLRRSHPAVPIKSAALLKTASRAVQCSIFTASQNADEFSPEAGWCGNLVL